jgi:hypothetical protein
MQSCRYMIVAADGLSLWKSRTDDCCSEGNYRCTDSDRRDNKLMRIYRNSSWANDELPGTCTGDRRIIRAI